MDATRKAPGTAGRGWGPNDSGDATAIALAAGGGALAIGDPLDRSPATGVFHPGDRGFARALASGGDKRGGSGAAHIYRRSASGRWALEAYVKAPRRSVFGWDSPRFGSSVALSADGAALATNAPQDARPAAYVYRRSASGRWALEARFKAPKRAGGWFGGDVALSADGAALAVLATDGSPATGVFQPGDDGLAGALASTGAWVRGAAHVYRRSASGRWALEAYVKASRTARSLFYDVALSADGAALAIGVPRDDSPAAGAFRRGDAGFGKALSASGARGSGAALVYRRSASGRWALDAYVKAPAPHSVGGGDYPGSEGFRGASLGDEFGHGVALSADGAALAVGAPGEDGSASGALHPGDPGFRGALSADGAENSGAVFLYELPARPAD